MTASPAEQEADEIVLIVDDDEALRQSLVDILALQGLQTVTAERGDMALELFAVHGPKAVVIDYHLPDMSGIELAQLIKDNSAETPVLLLTGFASFETAAAAVGKLDGYLTKPVDPQTFVQTVRGALDRSRLAESNRNLLERLQRVNDYQALYDHLTGLPNRALLDDRIDSAIAACEESGQSMAVLFVDLDEFKVVNDLFGHHVGDRVLREMGHRLLDSCRPTDTVARFGGDEFVVVLPDTGSPTEVCMLAARLIDRIAEPVTIEGSEQGVTASIGIALTAPELPLPTAEMLLRSADTAMYKAKEAGRARWELFDDAMRVRVTERFEIERGLRLALERGGFIVDYQPIVDLSTTALVAAEALIRWERPGHGRVLPGSFLDVAVESRLIRPIGTWVLDAVLFDIARWQREDQLPEDFHVWVNVAPEQMTSPDFSLCVEEALARHGVVPHLLGLEILEEGILDVAAAKAVLTPLRRIGVSLNLDDFGAGHSNLSLLQELPITGLKIDRRFVSADPTGDSRGSAIVSGLVGLGHALDLTVIAEGVETKAQAASVRSLGCELAQGYFYGYPAPGEDLFRQPDPVDF